MERTLKNYGLSISLFILFLVSWLGRGIFQWQEFANTQKEHGQEVRTTDFVPGFITSTFENSQSEFLQLFTFVLLSTYLIHKGSPQSRDSGDKVRAALQRIEKNIKK